VRREKAGRVNSYRDRRALVLGGLGFIGTHVAAALRSLGAEVTAVTRTPAAHRDAIASLEAAGIRVIGADLRDGDAMRAAVKGQDVVFHLAGQSGAVLSMEDPSTDLDVNCRGSLVLLDAMHVESPAARLVFASSRLAYGTAGSAPVAEEQLADPLCVHAVHKIAVEQYLRVYGRIYGLKFSVARLTNPYGPGQPGGRTAYGVVNHLIHLALAGERLRIYGDGSQRRDYIYIGDAVDALLRMGLMPEADGRIYNVGSGIGTRFVDMAQAITAIAGGGQIEHVPWPALAEQIETGDFVAGIGRIRRELGWEPRVSLADGLQRTVSQYKSQLSTLKAHPTMRVER